MSLARVTPSGFTMMLGTNSGGTMIESGVATIWGSGAGAASVVVTTAGANSVPRASGSGGSMMGSLLFSAHAAARITTHARRIVPAMVVDTGAVPKARPGGFSLQAGP